MTAKELLPAVSAERQIPEFFRGSIVDNLDFDVKSYTKVPEFILELSRAW
jgi:hypothetical protein